METSTGFVSQLKKGSNTARRAFNLIRAHKQLLFYPLIPTIATGCMLIVLALIGLLNFSLTSLLGSMQTQFTFLHAKQFFFLISPLAWITTLGRSMSIPLTLVLILFFSLVYIFCNTWTLAALTRHTHALVQNVPVSMRTTFVYTFSFYRPLILWIICSTLILIIPLVGQLVMLFFWFVIPVIIIGQVSRLSTIVNQATQTFIQLCVLFLGSELFILAGMLATFIIACTLFGLLLLVLFALKSTILTSSCVALAALAMVAGQIIITTWTTVTTALLYIERKS